MFELISVGDKIELKSINTKDDVERERKTYISQILDLDDEIIYAAMPIAEAHLVPLELGAKYDAIFKTEKSGLQNAICEVCGRNKTDKIYIVELKPITEFSEVQRREFFRLEAHIDITLYLIDEKHSSPVIEGNKVLSQNENRRLDGVIIDISAGGAKAMFKDSIIDSSHTAVVSFVIPYAGCFNQITLASKIVDITQSIVNTELYEYRIQFKDVSTETRELLVKYILEEQKRQIKKEKGN